MCDQLIGFLGRSIQARGVVDVGMHRKGPGGIGTINTDATGIEQVLNIVMAAALGDMTKSNQGAVDVGQRFLGGIPHTGLGGQIHHALRLVGFEQVFYAGTIGQIDPGVGVIRVLTRETHFSQRRIVVVVVVINTNNLFAALEETQ